MRTGMGEVVGGRERKLEGEAACSLAWETEREARKVGWEGEAACMHARERE